VAATAGCLLAVGLLVFPSGPFIRPHPVVWRLFFGVGVLYQLFLTFLLFQSRADARKLFTFFDPNLNKPLAERPYAENCEMTWVRTRHTHTHTHMHADTGQRSAKRRGLTRLLSGLTV
jgi:hypothetical protein